MGVGLALLVRSLLLRSVHYALRGILEMGRQVKDDDFEGCGISKIWATREDDPLKDACSRHDLMYLKGSKEQSIYSRKEVDKIFLNHMLFLAKTPFQTAKAYLFYGIARLCGGRFWEGKK